MPAYENLPLQVLCKVQIFWGSGRRKFIKCRRKNFMLLLNVLKCLKSWWVPREYLKSWATYGRRRAALHNTKISGSYFKCSKDQHTRVGNRLSDLRQKEHRTVYDMAMSDRVTILWTVEMLDLCDGAVNRISHSKLKVPKWAAKWAPRKLTAVNR